MEEYLEEIDLLEYVALFWNQKWTIFLIINIAVVGALVHTFFIADEVYQAHTSTMPLKSSAGGSLSALRSLVPAGLVSLPMSKGEEDFNRFVNILQSRLITEEVINSLDMVSQLYSDVPSDKQPEFPEIVEHLQGELISFTDNKKGLLVVTAKAPFPQLASDLANAYIQHLQRHLRDNTSTESRRNRVFAEKQYQKATRNLAQAEQRLQKFKEQNKLFSLTAQAEDIITRRGTLEGNLVAMEIKLEVLQKSNTAPNNPKYRTIKYQINAIERKIDEMNTGSHKATKQESVPLEAFPQIERELTQLMRETTVQETLYSLFAQEYEQAKISEAHDEISLAVLDPAIPPIRRVEPNRKLSLLLGGVVGLMLAFGYVILQNLLGKNKDEQSEKVSIE